jgi:hypothetical protein
MSLLAWGGGGLPLTEVHPILWDEEDGESESNPSSSSSRHVSICKRNNMLGDRTGRASFILKINFFFRPISVSFITNELIDSIWEENDEKAINQEGEIYEYYRHFGNKEIH